MRRTRVGLPAHGPDRQRSQHVNGSAIIHCGERIHPGLHHLRRIGVAPSFRDLIASMPGYARKLSRKIDGFLARLASLRSFLMEIPATTNIIY